MKQPIIYIVDDEPGIALLCERLLTREGYKAQSETDPRKAVEFFRDNPVSLLLVDIRMPNVDGFEVISRFKQHQPESAVLIMTGHGTVETAIRALRQGVDGIILKPFRQGSELVDAVRLAFLDNQSKRDAARIQALRPLFEVTESLLSETRREPLLELIRDHISDQLNCRHTACYQLHAKKYLPIMSLGSALPPDSVWIKSVDESSNPLMMNLNGPGDAEFKSLLSSLNLGSVILAPILRPNMRMVMYAARGENDPPFSESDLEMFQILSRQAAVALENSRLYEEQREYVRKVEDSQKALLQSEKMAAAGRLSASIAHEVNNPLQSMQNCLHLAAREDLPPEKRREYFDLARTELERLMLTVKRMLDFYRPNATEFEMVDVKEMLLYTINLMNKQFSEANLNVILDVAGTLKPIHAVGSQIQQVFINLALNAADAMTHGGELRISARSLKNGVEIIFADTGPGIPPDQQQNIFEPFFSTKEGGTGLGLTVSYNIITTHGGSLEYIPEQGAGACFRIYLPAGGEQ